MREFYVLKKRLSPRRERYFETPQGQEEAKMELRWDQVGLCWAWFGPMLPYVGPGWTQGGSCWPRPRPCWTYVGQCRLSEAPWELIPTGTWGGTPKGRGGLNKGGFPAVRLYVY